MQTGLVIFDLDGTLVDSMVDLADAMNAVLLGLGHPRHPRESYRHFVGDGIEMLVRRALPPRFVEGAEMSNVVAAMRHEYSNRWLTTTRPFPDIPELLERLRSHRIRIAILSNKPDFATQSIVQELFEADTFDVIRGALDRVALKPDPAAVFEILTRIGVEAERTVMVGDTPIDIQTGRNARVRTIGVTWGFRGAEELVDAGADFVVHQPFEILEILENLEHGVLGS